MLPACSCTCDRQRVPAALLCCSACIMQAPHPVPSCLQFLNQAGALVHVYTDGTVLVTHGGVEMGQGLHTKVAQVGSWSSALQRCLQP